MSKSCSHLHLEPPQVPGAVPTASPWEPRLRATTCPAGTLTPVWQVRKQVLGDEAAQPGQVSRLALHRSEGSAPRGPAGAATPGLGGRGCSGPAPRGRGRVRGPRRASQKSTGKLSSAFIFLNVTSFTMEMRVLIFRTHVSSVGSGCLLLILENEQHTEKKQRQESPGGPEARGRRRKRRNHEPPP